MNLARQADLLAGELRELGREARALIGQGRLTDLVSLGQRREQVLEQLRGLYPGGRVPPGPVSELLDEVERDADATQQLLTALRDELQRTIEAGRSAARAATSYVRNS